MDWNFIDLGKGTVSSSTSWACELLCPHPDEAGNGGSPSLAVRWHSAGACVALIQSQSKWQKCFTDEAFRMLPSSISGFIPAASPETLIFLSDFESPT